MTLTELKALDRAERKAAVCALSNDEMDRMAAEIQGWVIHRRCGVKEFWRLPYGSSMSKGLYHPSTDLNQAYALLEKCPDQRWWSEDDGEFGRFWAMEPRDVIAVFESEAGTHPRAVTALGILGLMEVGE